MAKIQFIGNQRSLPPFLADYAGREHLALFPAKAVASAFTDALAIVVTVDVAGAAQNATSVPVVALAPALPASTTRINSQVLIPAGSTLYFGGAKIAVTTADAKIGDTAIAVNALPTALVSADVAYFSKFNRIFLPAGTLVGRTYTERDAQTGFGPADVATPDDEIYLTAFDVENLWEVNDIEMIRHTARIKENYLPSYTTLSALVDEVQKLNFTGSPAGTFNLTFTNPTGVIVKTGPITYSGTAATLVSNINTAVDAALGSTLVVASGSAVTAISMTFSGAGYTHKPQDLVRVDDNGLTAGLVAVSRTNRGGNAWLETIRANYACFKGQD